MNITPFKCMYIYSWFIVFFNHYNKSDPYYDSLKNHEPIDNIYKIINHSINTVNNPKHYWIEEINDEIQKKISKINDELIDIIGGKHKHDYIPSMTELYYSSKSNKNSDNQYILNHMDGPFYTCGVHRVIITINGNKNIDTHFPDHNMKINLKMYDFVIFNYNNEAHYIKINEDPIDNNQRILLKLHYIRKNYPICKEVHCKFGRETRILLELNKHTIKFSGLLSKISLFYNTNRKYILLFVYLMVCYSNSSYITYTFLTIEFSIIIYMLHFLLPIYNKECNL